MCKKHKKLLSYEHQRELAIKHQKIEMKDVYIYYKNGAYGYTFDLSYITGQVNIEKIKFNP